MRARELAATPLTGRRTGFLLADPEAWTPDRIKTLDDLIEPVDDWTDHWNDNGAPFTWTKTADEILAKVRSARGSLERQIKVATDH